MSLTTSINLIDLSAEDVNEENPSNNSKLKKEDKTSENNQINPNNPFDDLLREVDAPSDPFEMLSKAAESYQVPSHNIVVTDNLLELENEPYNANTQDDVLTASDIKVPRLSCAFSSSSNKHSSISSLNSQPSPSCDIFNSPIASTSMADSALTINKGFNTDKSTTSIDASKSNILNRDFIDSPNLSDTGLDSITNKEATSSSAPDTSDTNSPESGSKKKRKSKLESRNLLKISLSNAVNTPQRRQSKHSDDSFERCVLAEAGNLHEQLSKMVLSSPKVSEDSCDDLMSINPNWVDSETDIDSDLESLKIPILQELERSKKNKITNVEDAVSFELQEQENRLQTDIKSTLPDLESLKEKIRLTKSKEHNTDISHIIDGLKRIIFDCSNEEKKSEANGLLESLSSLLNTENNTEKTSPATPQPIIRQGTFDLDIPRKQPEESPIKNVSNKEKDLKTPEPDTQGAPDFLRQIGKMFGNDNINIIQGNMSTDAAAGSNPTYIVVMGTPNNSKNFGIQSNDGSPDLSARKRSSSLSLHDKKPTRMSTQVGNAEKSRSDFITPARPATNRRNSISYSPYQSVSAVRRSIYSSNAISTGKDVASKPVQKPNIRDKENDIKPKIAIKTKPDLNVKNLRVKSNEQVRKSQGPMKATIPIKKVSPMMKTPSVSSPIEDSKKLKATTSTPLPTSKGFPAACSTPAIKVKILTPSPAKNASKSKTRYSYLSTTPNPKARLSVSSSSHVRRRSLTDLNSPNMDSVKNSGISKPQVRTMKLPQEFTKRLSRIAPNKVGSKIDLKAEVAKENKQPKGIK